MAFTMSPHVKERFVMSFIGNLVRTAILGAVLATGPSYASAQEVSASQLAAALDVVHSAKASRGFDNVLPSLAAQVQDRLIRIRPDLHKQIADTVEAVALKLAVRRTDLDTDVARVWAKHFSEEELNTIATFYKSPAGQKFADVGSLVYAESLTAVQKWSDRVGDEMLDNAQKELKSQGIDIR
jgi:hypothetical protein